MPSRSTLFRKAFSAAFFLWISIAPSLAAANHPAQNAARTSLPLNSTRSQPSDLELGGELAGLPAGTTRFVTLDSLLALPQVTYTVTDDSNFANPTKISGVPLENLARLLGADPAADLVVAICDDKYRANYSREYVKDHGPLLVLRVNGELAPGWPKDPESHSDMGPYMISHPKFTAKTNDPTRSDEAQIPWGVVRLEFRDEKTVYAAIAPPAARANDASVQAGYKVAQEYCFHCHNAGQEGGQKAGRSWQLLAVFASASPGEFSAYIRDPKSRDPAAKMPPNPDYDDATIKALRDYFAAFAPAKRP